MQPPAQPPSIYYDKEVDTLYIHFKKPSHATDSELTDDDVIVRYENDEVIGLTILHASRWITTDEADWETITLSQHPRYLPGERNADFTSYRREIQRTTGTGRISLVGPLRTCY